ncbi:MAG: LysR family transcriptional regulator [Gammaproteobacteria bacterium]|nr:LysR family transcriptional regulator [Gammaproteobacteria bacterium]
MLSKSELLRVFVVAAESKTFRDAADKLHMSPQSVSRVIKMLEGTYGELLFHRSTRTIKITKFGEQLLSRASHALDVMNDVFLFGQKKNNHDELSGNITITTPDLIGRDFLYPLLSDFHKKYPKIHIDIRASNSFSHLVDEQIDIGIRVGKIKNNGFIVRKVNEIKFFLVASPEAINNFGTPKHVEDLKNLPAIEAIDCNSGKGWPWLFADGIEIHPGNVNFRTDDPEIERLAILDGFGFGQISDWIANNDIKNGHLIRLLEESEPEPWDVYVYRPQKGPVPARVRLLYDSIVDYLSMLKLD